MVLDFKMLRFTTTFFFQMIFMVSQFPKIIWTKTGNTVLGNDTSPKEGEKYLFTLLK